MRWRNSCSNMADIFTTFRPKGLHVTDDSTFQMCLMPNRDVSRGWIENKSKRGATFDLRWTLHDFEVGYASLKRGQMVNHFEGNHEITTKGALCRLETRPYTPHVTKRSLMNGCKNRRTHSTLDTRHSTLDS
jgi:hypothetical protein